MARDNGIGSIGQAYDAGDEIVILGTPNDPESWADDDPRRHNCDTAGCGCAHVLYRFRKTPNAVLSGAATENK